MPARAPPNLQKPRLPIREQCRSRRLNVLAISLHPFSPFSKDHARTHARMHARRHTHAHTYTNPPNHTPQTHAHAWTHACTRTLAHTCTCTHAQLTGIRHAHANASTRTHTHTRMQQDGTCLLRRREMRLKGSKGLCSQLEGSNAYRQHEQRLGLCSQMKRTRAYQHQEQCLGLYIQSEETEHVPTARTTPRPLESV